MNGNNVDQEPLRYCGLVMKGGITSGVVYPLAATKLAEAFTFKNIGGTSAGAIAAAATAAAELGRGSKSGGFERLKDLPRYLSEISPKSKNSNLFNFFRPQPKTQKLFNVFVSALGGGNTTSRIFCSVIRHFWLSMLVGALFGLVLFGFSCHFASGVFFILCMIASVIVLLVGVCVALVFALLQNIESCLPDNFYGLCTGLTEEFKDVTVPSQPGQPLTYWLTEYLDELAGKVDRDALLTFGDLWGHPDLVEPTIRLEMMTTCLTHGRPYRLPFRDDDDIKENGLFYFRPDEFQQFFPKKVVDWLEKHPRQPSGDNKTAKEKREQLRLNGYYPLPDPRNLPVVVAVRMSLSFPILLSAVPLYAVDRLRDPEGKKPERCWFSDGGICSNFPIHFFDEPLPRWPTFSVDLTAHPEGTSEHDLATPDMPKSNGGRIQENWNRFEFSERIGNSGEIISKPRSGLGKITGLIFAIIQTMQNWGDNTQSRLPGYRDRIARVGLTPKEGGLNLNMPEDRITKLSQRGESAGREFIKRFSMGSVEEMNWENHRWLRMRAMLASLQQMLGSLHHSSANPQKGDQAYQPWIDKTQGGKGAPSYQWKNNAQRDLALLMLEDLCRLTQKLEAEKISLSDGAPHPRPELRIRPRL